MNIFDQYGIKEVADVTLYSIHKKKDGSGELYYVPALYFDTLKISTVEKTADNVWATGGLGNANLICWDFGKQISVQLEDALCTPASLGLCWGGILSSDWKDGEVKQDRGIIYNHSGEVESLSRMEKAFYSKPHKKGDCVGKLLPLIEEDLTSNPLELPIKSSITDGVRVNGMGEVNMKTYKWHLKIESGNRSVAFMPDRVFDYNKKPYLIDPDKIICQNNAGNGLGDYRLGIIYFRKKSDLDNSDYKDQIIVKDENISTTLEGETAVPVTTEKNWTALKLIVTNDEILAYTTTKENMETIDDVDAAEWIRNTTINTTQFAHHELWMQFKSLNALNYFLLTKYENDIEYIAINDIASDVYSEEKTDLEDTESIATAKDKLDLTRFNSLWAYVNPQTMTPYDDDYWFHQGEPYYKKSLTLNTETKKIKAQRIYVKAGQFPGMYMMVGETWIRDRDTGKDERMQLKFPLCKVMSEQTINLEAAGDPTTFNFNLEVASPQNGIMMELTSYEIEKQETEEVKGVLIKEDGSTKVMSE